MEIIGQNFAAKNRVIIANKAAVLSFTNDETPGAFVLNVASTPAADTYAAGVFSHYFIFGKPTDVFISNGAPMLAKFGEVGNVVVLSFKLVGPHIYLYGISVENLIEWEPPTGARDVIEEEKVITLWKLPDVRLESLTRLVNTSSETHNLKDLADNLIKHLPSFKKAGVKSSKDAVDRVKKNSFVSVVREAAGVAERSERAPSAERGRRSRDQAESAEGGAVSGDRWKGLREAAERALPYLAGGSPPESFLERLIVVETEPGMRMPTEEKLASLRADLE